MKQKQIESKLTKAKERLGKVTAKVTRLESRLEKVKKKKAGSNAPSAPAAKPPKTNPPIEKKTKSEPASKSLKSVTRAKSTGAAKAKRTPQGKDKAQEV